MSTIPELIRHQVFARAHHCCEYCQTARRLIGMPLVIDHIIPLSRNGTDEFANLAAACYRCNEYKGARTEGVDPATNELAPLFNPRIHRWREHLQWVDGGRHIAGITPIGRATVLTLRLNNDYVVESRMLWVHQGWHPPRFE
jgi:hypothetical protein